MAGDSHDKISEWPLLAGLRFVLALVVVASHVKGFGPGIPILSDLDAEAAVAAFLVVSGYSIAASLERSAQGFYARRARRILPLYFLVLAVSGLPFVMWGSARGPWGIPIDAPSTGQYAAHLVFLQGIACDYILSIKQTWSLAIEVRWYAVAPLLRRTKWLGPVLLVASLAHWIFDAGSVLSSIGGQLIWWGWAWLIGWQYYQSKKSYLADGIMVASVALALWAYNPFHVANSPFVGAVSCLVIAASRRIALPSALHGVLNWLGDLSYPLYISHFGVMMCAFGPTKGVSPYLATGLSLFAAAVLDGMFDKPIKRILASRVQRSAEAEVR
jgi:peptidoglycan/LPS O-acetylase OafA/YrhL